MALSYVNPKNGAVVATIGTASDFNSFDYSESQPSESVIAYGAAVYDPYRGNGTPHASTSASGIAKHGAANTPPGFGSSSGGTVDFDGGTVTLTLDTGVTLAATMVMTSLRVSHARARAAVPLAFQFEGGGDTTVTWPTS
jgi:hypothetical protein